MKRGAEDDEFAVEGELHDSPESKRQRVAAASPFQPHPRNRYAGPLDLRALMEKHPSLQEFIRKKGGSNSGEENDPEAVEQQQQQQQSEEGYKFLFHNKEASVALTKALLLEDYGLQWEHPVDQLCPPLTNRLNYIHWIQDLLEETQPEYLHRDQEGALWGIDIGTGASCVYPLLGHKEYGWRFVATEVDPVSVEFARNNVARNGLDRDIVVVHVQPRREENKEEEGEVEEEEAVEVAGPSFAPMMPPPPSVAAGPQLPPHLKVSGGSAPPPAPVNMGTELPILVDASGGNGDGGILPAAPAKFAFCMCNPPFFGDESEYSASQEGGSVNPFTGGCNATDLERYVQGGEVAFVGQIIRDSMVLLDRVLWYTSMLGKRSSLKPLKQKLKDLSIKNVRTYRLAQGHTHRWVLAWSFTDAGMQHELHRQTEDIQRKEVEKLQGPTESGLGLKFLIRGGPGTSAKVILRHLRLLLEQEPQVQVLAVKEAEFTLEAQGGAPQEGGQQPFTVKVMQMEASVFVVHIRREAGPRVNGAWSRTCWPGWGHMCWRLRNELGVSFTVMKM